MLTYTRITNHVYVLCNLSIMVLAYVYIYRERDTIDTNVGMNQNLRIMGPEVYSMNRLMTGVPNLDLAYTHISLSITYLSHVDHQLVVSVWFAFLTQL